MLRYSPGSVGVFLRYHFYKKRLKHIGRNVLIDEGVYLINPENLCVGDNSWIDKNVIIFGRVEIGRRVHIAQNCIIQGGGFVKIGDYAGIAAGSMIYSSTDTIYGGKRIGPMVPPEHRNPLLNKPVIIGKDAFIGLRCVILPGVKIGEGAVIGAGSVVTRDIPAWKVAVGVPAKPIKDRPRITLPDI